MRCGAALGLAGAVVFCAASRGWLIAHTEVIARDGTQYVSIARQWGSSPSAAIEGTIRHVGYPAAMAWFHALTGLPDDLDAWVLAGQWVSLLSAVAATGAIWAFAAMTFDWRLATVSALLFTAGRKWACAGADVLSDALFVALAMGSLVAALWMHRRLVSGRLSAVWAGLLAGALAGAAYLVRVEGLVATALGVGVVAIALLGGLRRYRLSAASACGMVGATLVVALPYALAVGGLTKNKRLDDFFSAGLTDGSNGLPLGMVLPHLPGVGELLGELDQALHTVVTVLAVIYVSALLLGFTWRRGSLPAPAWPARWLMAGSVVLLGVPALLQFRVHGFISHRYMLLPAAMICSLAGGGVLVLREVMLAAAKRLRLPCWPGVGLVGLVIAVGLPMTVDMLEPLHHHKGYLRSAGDFLHRYVRQRGGGRVAADSPLVAFYSRQPEVGLLAPDGRLHLGRLGRQDPNNGVTLLAVRTRTLRREVADSRGLLSEALVPPAFEEIHSVVQTGVSDPETVHVYRVDPRRIPASMPVLLSRKP